MGLFEKRAEDYGSGSKGNDFLSVEDGSDTNQNAVNTTEQSNGDGQGNVPKGGDTLHPVTPFGEQGHYNDDSSSTDGKKDDGGVAEMPYGQEAVDDNHSDGGYSSVASKDSFLNLFKIAHDDEADFMTSNISGGPADSPQKMKDGLPPEDYMTVKPTVNNYLSQTDDSAAALFEDPGVVNKENPNQNSPEINQGRRANKNPYFFSHIGFKKKANNESNVDAIMNPDEEDNKHDRSTNDYGDSGRMGTDPVPMAAAPLDQHLGIEEESQYSGVANASVGSFLHLFDKKADYNGEMPSANPNSGRDPEDEIPLFSGANTTQTIPAVMSDGKNAADSCNEQDKIDVDVSKARRKVIYQDRVEDDDKINYYQVLNSGGGYGMEGDSQNQSGVAN